MAKRVIWLATAVVIGGLLMGGCGGSGDNTSVAGISMAQYLKRAERICGEGEDKKYAQIGVALKASGKNASEVTSADLEEVTRVAVVPALREMVDRLEALPPVMDEAAMVDRWVETLDGELTKVEQEPSRFVAGTAFTEANAQAEAMKMANCVLN